MPRGSLVTAQRRRPVWYGMGGAGLSWLLPLLVVTAVRQDWVALATVLLFIAGGALYLVCCAPWKYPMRPFAVIYLGLLAIIIVAACTLLWLLAPTSFSLRQGLVALSPLATLLIPALIFGRRAWDDLGPVLMRRDDDGCR